MGGREGLVLAEDASDDSLDSAVWDSDGFEVWVCGLESDVVGFAEEGFECGFAVGEERDDSFAVACGVCAFDEYVVAVEYSFVFHGVAVDAECEDAA